MCVAECPTGAIQAAPPGPRRPHKVQDEVCLDCGACMPVCPVGAIVSTESDAGIRHGWSLLNAREERHPHRLRGEEGPAPLRGAVPDLREGG
ncbi:4Fe-4S binding protein [Myxococcota bacterium]|nr:4Fe-4S binding protein [Myxococcota bacterium]